MGIEKSMTNGMSRWSIQITRQKKDINHCLFSSSWSTVETVIVTRCLKVVLNEPKQPTGLHPSCFSRVAESTTLHCVNGHKRLYRIDRSCSLINFIDISGHEQTTLIIHLVSMMLYYIHSTAFTEWHISEFSASLHVIKHVDVHNSIIMLVVFFLTKKRKAYMHNLHQYNITSVHFF